MRIIPTALAAILALSAIPAQAQSGPVFVHAGQVLDRPGTVPTMKGALTLTTSKPGRPSARAPSHAARRDWI